MATVPAPHPTSSIQRTLSPLAGVLSYLVPGLGQISQGRVGKGLLFLVCIYTLFFHGLYLGTASVTIDNRPYHVSGSVFLPDAAVEGQNERSLPPLAQNLYSRPQFAGQFWAGVVAWPAIIQYLGYDRREAERVDRELEDLYRDAPETRRKEITEKEASQRHPLLGDFMREPSPRALNAVLNAGDKRLELAWVFTVIAGVLNVMVIYDAVAGPAYPSADPEPEKKERS